MEALKQIHESALNVAFTKFAHLAATLPRFVGVNQFLRGDHVTARAEIILTAAPDDADALKNAAAIITQRVDDFRLATDAPAETFQPADGGVWLRKVLSFHALPVGWELNELLDACQPQAAKLAKYLAALTGADTADAVREEFLCDTTTRLADVLQVTGVDAGNEVWIDHLLTQIDERAAKAAICDLVLID